MMRITGSILIGLCVLITNASAGQETIPERVRRHQGAVEIRVLREFSPVGLAELLKDSDLIVRAVILDDGRSYLAKNDRAIYSDFTGQVLDEIFSRRGLKVGQTLAITKPGGTMTVEGFPVTSRESDFPAFQANEEYVLFLKFDDTTERYLVQYGAQGAFRNIGGFVEQVSDDTGTWNSERGRVPIAEFTRALVAQMKEQ